MSEKKQDLRELADRLRGLDQKTVGQAREAGKQLSQQAVSRVQTVKEISAPTATPKIEQAQSAAVRQRHVTEKQPQNVVGRPAAGQAAQEPSKSLAEAAKGLREAGVTGGRAANDISPAKQTPAVEQKQSRGRGR